MNTTWGWNKARAYYYTRTRGIALDERSGATIKVDDRERIPDDVFVAERVPATKRTPRGDVVAAGYAAKVAKGIADTPTNPKWQRMTLAEIGELWLERRKRKDPQTLVSDRLMIGHLVSFFGDRDPSTIDISAMELYRDTRLDADYVPRLGKKAVRKISARTVFNECGFARRLLAFGYDRKSETGMRALELMHVPEVEGKAGRGGARKLTMPEFWRIYEAAGSRPRVGEKSQLILALGLATWLRLEALVNLQWAWIDWVAKTVTVPREFMKGGQRELTLPLSAFALAALERARKLHQHERYVLPVSPITGKPSTNLFHTLAAIAEDAQARPFSLHGVRKTAATTILNHRCEKHPHGVLKIVADTILAHTVPRNDDAYFLVDVETMREALGIIDEAWQDHSRREGATVVEMAARRA